ncbi:hypothetical protein [Haladaptatus sp. DYSN1]|uniref:hypothetical protein n=1 Tax=unclassified Haladaptatus TaxID=2622732 RepID=UPI002404AF91|nr:hypothetical protein [Haladaptatus sp. DYSN1]
MEERSLLVLIAQQLLLGAMVILGVLWIYLAIRFIRAFEQIASALQQIAEKERA